MLSLPLAALFTVSAASPLGAQTNLPVADAPFAGKIARNVRDAKPAWPEVVHAPKGAPNVLLILVDDVGFSTTSTFGGPVPTPAFDRLAASGLKYNRFHVNAICSPSRATLLSGRNNHQIGYGTISEHAQGYPGYNSIWPLSSQGIARVLQGNGYNTAAFGKWHNTPVWEINAGGPFNHWPTGEGFDYFYGFLAAFDSEYTPRLYRNTTPVEPPKTVKEGYHLTTDLANDAITWLHRHDAAAPDKPFFLYFATGATHTPHHVPKEWIAKFKGKFDQGWDKLREENFEREKKMGIIPQDAKLTPRPAGLAAWDSLSHDEKKLLAHQAEVYAAFTAQADYEIGRVIKAIQDEGKLDNTLIIEIFGDNGGSGEDGPTGYDVRQINGQLKGIAARVEQMDDLGGELYMNATAAPWAYAFSTPFPGTKADASHLGGTRDPMVISWPSHIHPDDKMRTQFGHLNDIAPTIFEAAGITPPTTVDGIKQTQWEGTSLVYTFDHPDAKSRHHIQYFETNGNKAIYKDGWWAGNLLRSSWDRIGTPGYEREKLLDDNTHPWELYNLDEDYSQAVNLADKYPQKLAEMKALFDSEAKRNQVYPLLPLRELISRPEDSRTKFVFRSGVDRLGATMNVHTGAGTGYTITAEVENKGHADGVILAQGGHYGGITLFVKNNRVHFEINSSSHPSGEMVATTDLPMGHSTIVVEVAPSPSPEVPAGTKRNGVSPFPGTGKLMVNGKQEATAKFINVPASGGYWSPAESLDIGSDLGSAVSTQYESPARFTGTIDTVTLELHEPANAGAKEKAARNDGHS
ncbi:MAG: arylsulfatase [Acidobacteria bacterium]|nr:arylsulfatase [Acidobacteriota bacterium]